MSLKYYLKSILDETELEPELKRKDSFGRIQDPNPKDLVSGTQYAIRLQEPSEYGEGYVFVYDIKNNNEICTRLFWEWNDEFNMRIPQTHFIETSKQYEGRKLSLLAYRELINTYEKLITDKQLTQMSINNWSRNMYPIFKNNIFLISDDSFLPWNGDPNIVIGTKSRIIILKNNSDIKRMKRKYSDLNL